MEANPAPQPLAYAEAKLRDAASRGGAGLSTGDVIKVSRGAETFSPIKYNTFTVGPVGVETQVRAGETPDEAYLRAIEQVEVLFQVEYDMKVQHFFKRLKEVNERARAYV